MKKKEKWFLPTMAVMFLLQLITIFYFCNLKQGFHYDEYYSYYSSNATNALFMPEMGWKDGEEIRSEFQVLKGASLNYGLVNEMQSLDVHPPLYYFLLHTVCGLSKGIFSKWQGIAINLLFFVLSWFLLIQITRIFSRDKMVIASVCLLFGFSPAIYSGISFIRMYMMLSFECLLFLYIHLKALKENRFGWKNFFLPAGLVSFIGFYTHYYFAVFLFFTALAVFIYLLFQKEYRKKAVFYACSVGIGLFMVVLVYPSCLRHIFRGYRGTEAMGEFFSLSNIVDRLNFFYDLTNEYVFGSMLSILLLAVIVLLLTVGLLQKKGRKKKIPCRKEMVVMIVVTLGYFLVVAKTALLNAEEAIRYEMPIYGMIIALVCIGLWQLIEFCCRNPKTGELTKKRQLVWKGIFSFLVLLVLVGQILALSEKKVCFLYEDDAENIAWAKEKEEATVAYIYVPDRSWMIWDESLELMQYDEIYFLSSGRETVEKDEKLSDAEEVYVYVMRGENTEQSLENLEKKNDKTSCTKIRELLYCDLYLLQ